VEDGTLVEKLDGVGDLGEEGDAGAAVEGVGRAIAVEVLAVDEIGGDVEAAGRAGGSGVERAVLEDTWNAGESEGGEGFELVPGAAGGAGFGAEGRREVEDFEGDGLVVAGAEGAVDDTGAAAADFAVDGEAGGRPEGFGAGRVGVEGGEKAAGGGETEDGPGGGVLWRGHDRVI
jgi:hypothetical protein